MNLHRQALALLEFDSVALGVQAVDRLLKRSPIALLQCGTVHPGHWLALVCGTVASVETAYEAGIELAETVDAVFLPAPHPALGPALAGSCAAAPQDAALGVLETTSSPGLLRAVDAALKAAPVLLGQLRLADDLSGRGLALLHGEQPDVEAALEAAAARVGPGASLLGASLLPRLDGHLRDVLNAGTLFHACAPTEPVGAERLEEV
jgi:microcompartment protein CcmL/EutN